MPGLATDLHDAKGLVPLQQRQRRVVQAAQQVFHHLVHWVLIACRKDHSALLSHSWQQTRQQQSSGLCLD